MLSKAFFILLLFPFLSSDFLSAQNISCCPMGTVQGPEQIINGDFELGNSGFLAPCFPYFTPGGLTSIGKYSVLTATQVQMANSQWACTNHTIGFPNGQMLIVDGASNNCNLAWQQLVFVTKGVEYSYCAFLNNLVVPGKNYVSPIVELWINNIQVASITIPESPDAWQSLNSTWTANFTGYATLSIRLGETQSIGNDFAVDDISFRSCEKAPACHCGPFEILFALGRGPLEKLNCGSTLDIPANDQLFTLRFLTSFTCIGTNCDTPKVDWILTGPPGFTPLMANNVTATPAFTIPISIPSFYLNGIYTLTMTGYCGKDTCPCIIYFNQQDNCCQSQNSFCNRIMNAVSIAVDNKLCKAKLNISNLNYCDSIPIITWGDGTVSTGHFSSGSMAMHNYSASGNYIISWTAYEYDNQVPAKICFEKIFRDTITLNCKKDSCVCGPFELLYAISRQPALPYHCGDTLTAPLSSSGLAVNLYSSFHCIGSACDSTTQVQWTLSGPNLPPFQNIVTTSSNGSFPNPINAAIFANPGLYTLELEGYCGKDTCRCKIYFNVSNPCCDCKLFSQQVLSNVNVIVNQTLCKATVNVGDLSCKGFLQNISWGDSQQSSGPFYSGSMPMHTYANPGQYIISYLAIQLDPATGLICCEKPVRDTFFLDCTIMDTCECKGFSPLFFYNSNWSNVYQYVSCNPQPPIVFTLPCLKPGQNPLFYLHGNLNCNGKNCIKDTLQWNIIEMPTVGSSIAIANGSTSVNTSDGHFNIGLNQSWFNSTSSYMLALTGHCGTQTCTCKINFKFATCPCPCDSLQVDVSKGFKVTGTSPFVSCKRKFMPIDLCINDAVTWTVSGLGVVGTTIGNNTIIISFPGSGWYNVCMFVMRTENGQVCKREYCRKVKVKCIKFDPTITKCSIDSTSSNGVTNGDFQNGTQGELGNEGLMPNWNLFPNTGDGFVFVDDSTGASDDGHLILNGNQNNFAGVWQMVNLSSDDYTIIDYAQRNYLGENTPKGTVLEFRLQTEPILGSPYQVILRDTINVADSSSWVIKAHHESLKSDKDKHYLVVCLQNSSNEYSVVGIDNLEMCSSQFVNTNQYKPFGKIKIVPNPNSGYFQIELPYSAAHEMKFNIIDISGRQIKSQGIKNGLSIVQVNDEDLLSGFYFIQIILENRIMTTQKFVKE